jgi:signal transduction histidine kinase
MLAFAGRGKTSMQRLDLSQLVGGLDGTLRASTSNQAELRFELGVGLPAIRADAEQIRQVVSNLVTNACESLGGRGGTVTVTTGSGHYTRAEMADNWLQEDLPGGTYAWLAVADTGSGMDATTLSRIVDPFFTTKFTGRGLGLASVVGIVRGHRGALRIHSKPGEGSTFSVLFPADPA